MKIESTLPDMPASILVWDDLGIRLYSDTSKEPRVETATIVLKQMNEWKEQYNPYPPEISIDPVQTFTGSVSIHGAIPITANSTIRELRDSGGRDWIFSCTKGVGVCFTHDANQKESKLTIAFEVDGRIEESPIYTLSIKK